MGHVPTQLLAQAGRLLLEYNDSTGEICHTLAATARALTPEACEVSVAYSGVIVEMAGERPLRMPVRELRYNAALQSRVHWILRQVRSGQLDPSVALAQLQRVEEQTPPMSQSLTMLLLGFAAASLAGLLGADLGTVIVSGVATSLGLAARQELGRHHFSMLALPFVAGFVGAVLGGLAVRFSWTATPELALIVPSLMLIPGPHLINGLLDLVDNYVPMSIARLTLAISILVAIAIGIVLGIELTLPDPPLIEQNVKADHLNLLIDMLLAGIVTIGFAAYYNTPGSHLALATVGGMAGHGLRFLALEMGAGLVSATFVGAVAVGAISAWVVRSYRAPFAVIAFAGAVTMMPGLQIYRALGGALGLARLREGAAVPSTTATLGHAFQACLVVIALAVGLIIASRVVQLLAGDKNFSAVSLEDSDPKGGV